MLKRERKKKKERKELEIIRDQEDDKKKILNQLTNFPIVRRLGATNCSNISYEKRAFCSFP